MAEECIKLATRLSQRLDECGIKDKNANRLLRAKRILRCIWNKREIDEINTQLEYFRGQLMLHKVHEIQQIQGKSHASQASQNDIREVKALIEDLAPNLDANAAEILRYIAEVRVENSQLLARAIQEAPSASVAAASIQHLVKTVLDEYEDRMATNVEKRFRNAFASEFDNIRKSLPQCFADLQTHQSEEKMQETDGTGNSKYTSRGGDVYSNPVPTPPYPQRVSQQGETKSRNDVIFTHRSLWRKRSRLGMFCLKVARYIMFDEHGHPTSVYDLSVTLLPLSCWFTTGCFITYQSFTDRRGKPKMVLQPEVFRVLDPGHEYWTIMEQGDTLSLQELLKGRQLAPSDRCQCGDTLLHVR